MKHPNESRFQDFFTDDRYVTLKNHLYNYLVRRWTIERHLSREDADLIVEVGSGLSPVMTRTDRIIYSDLSLEGLRNLRRYHGKGWYVVADCTRLPFKTGAVSHAVSSEVLEHIEDDQGAIRELARVLRPQGRLFVTFPHRKFYFWNDDRFVRHFRRYELEEMTEKLQAAGLRPCEIRKVLGPLEKIAMSLTIFCIGVLQRVRGPSSGGGVPGLSLLAPAFKWANRAFACAIWLDARIMPRALSAVLLIKAEKD